MPRSEDGRAREREFEFTPRDFEQVQQLVAEKTGIALSDIKSNMVYSRLARRLRATGHHSFQDYLGYLKHNEGELNHFVNALTTNLTAFFREAHHFDHLAEVVLPGLMADIQARGKPKRINMWSAGCSSGEEPYSMAMVAREVVPPPWEVRILASDLDTEVLRRAETGVYDQDRVKGLSTQRLKDHFLRGVGRNEGRVKVRREVRALVDFQKLNLIERPWPLKESFHVVFCRNTIIYFEKDTQRTMFKEMRRFLERPAWLYIGHSETLWQVADDFESLGQTIYRLDA